MTMEPAVAPRVGVVARQEDDVLARERLDAPKLVGLIAGDQVAGEAADEVEVDEPRELIAQVADPDSRPPHPPVEGVHRDEKQPRPGDGQGGPSEAGRVGWCVILTGRLTDRGSACPRRR